MGTAPEKCILCGGTEKRLLIEKKPWSVHSCSSCGLGYLDPRPSIEEMQGLYDKEYCDENFAEGGKPGTPEFKKRISLESSRVRFFRRLKKKGKILDIGCGYGHFLAACREKGYDVHGIDFSDWAVKHAVEVLDIPVSFGNVVDIDLPENSFDVITMWHTLEHAHDPEQLLFQAIRWLKKDGVLITDVPNHKGTEAVNDWYDWKGWDMPYHYYHFTPETLTKLLEKCGLKVVKSKDYHSDFVKMKLKKIPVVSLFARMIAKLYSGHSVAMASIPDKSKNTIFTGK